VLQDLPRIPEARVKDVRIEGGGVEPVHAALADGTFSLVDRGEDEAEKAYLVSGLKRVFDRLQFNSIADPALTDAQTGLDVAVECRVTDDSGLIMIARVGAAVPDGTDRYARFVLELPPADAGSEDAVEARAALEREIAETNARLSRWVYILPIARAADMIRSRAEFVEPPPAPLMDADEANAEALEDGVDIDPATGPMPHPDATTILPPREENGGVDENAEEGL
jgi:hypothetical protein